MRYEVINDTYYEFNKMIKLYIANGWEPHGGVSVYRTKRMFSLFRGFNVRYVQAMIKKDESTT